MTETTGDKIKQQEHYIMTDRFSRYNQTEKGKARNRKAQANLSPEQKELQRIRKRDYMRRKRAEKKQQEE